MIKIGFWGFAASIIIASLVYFCAYVPVLSTTNYQFMVGEKTGQFVKDYKDGRLYVGSKLITNPTLESPQITINFYTWPDSIPKTPLVFEYVIARDKNQTTIFSTKNVKLSWYQLGNGQYRSSFTSPNITHKSFAVSYRLRPCESCDPIEGKVNYQLFKRTNRYTITEYITMILKAA